MNAHPLELDVYRLLAPLPGDCPAGDGSLYAYTLSQRFSELRRQEHFDDFDEATRPAELKKADWAEVVRLAVETLSTQSKDLRVACHLVEGLTETDGLRGLAQGLELLLQLIEGCWDRLWPEPADGDTDPRIAVLANLLDDTDRGICFPQRVRAVPLLGSGAGGINLLAWRQLRASQEDRDRRQLQAALQATPLSRLQEQAAQSQQCLAYTRQLAAVLDERLGPDAPALLHLQEAISDCHRQLQGELQGHGVGPQDSPPAEIAASDPAAVAPQATDATDAVERRAALYRQLQQTASLLEQIEPHSPAPYLVRRAVQLGRLPFPSLIQTLVREEHVAAEILREFGMAASSATGHDGG